MISNVLLRIGTIRSSVIFSKEKEEFFIGFRVSNRSVDYSSNLTDFLFVSGDWEVDKIKDWLPDDVVSKIAVIPPPSPWKDKDQIAWALTSDGCFKLKSAYQDLQNTTDISSNIFSLIKARYEEYLHVMNVHWRQKHNKPAAYPLAPSS
ncbi:hypothetical protein Ahy_B02g058355 isoform H [Arachis hypogaea]|uniref:Uncharacterized protein n=1 Tax=Arachis hypogaea TaxID=3818 RepID=A0A445AEG2_ARAHY|nr:hypothetical protein Ahy_B02g058355 isoform H [Arachis hypogaea]